MYKATGPNATPESAVKIYEPDPKYKSALDPLAARNAAYPRYKLAAEILGERSVQVTGVFQDAQGRPGIGMKEIARPIRIYRTEFASAKTLEHLDWIRDALLKRHLYIVDFQFTIDEKGQVILYDLDGLTSWDPGSPFYSSAQTEDGARKYFEKKIEFWKQMAREDIHRSKH